MNKLLQLDFRRLNLGWLDPRRRSAIARQPGGTVLGLVFDGSRLEGVEVRRTNGSVEIKKSFTATLSLNLLTAEPELVGRELRKHLDAAGVRERRCVVGLPLNWALTLAVPLPPDLAAPDVQSLLQI
jgi:Tfp pilus assembly PilM family ATPase